VAASFKYLETVPDILLKNEEYAIPLILTLSPLCELENFNGCEGIKEISPEIFNKDVNFDNASKLYKRIEHLSSRAEHAVLKFEAATCVPQWSLDFARAIPFQLNQLRANLSKNIEEYQHQIYDGKDASHFPETIQQFQERVYSMERAVEMGNVQENIYIMNQLMSRGFEYHGR